MGKSNLKEKVSTIWNNVVLHWKTPALGKYVPYKEIIAYGIGGMGVQFVMFFCSQIALSATSGYFSKSLPFASKLGWFGQVFLSYGFLAYLAILIALLASYFLKHTRPGLHLRAVGESASTADAAGINVTRYKYVATCVGGMIAGLGGLFYVMDYSNGIWSNNGFGDRGWLAIAIVIFATWKPIMAIFGSYLFGAL